MSLLIDGYNLLHASGVLARGVGPGSLERTRGALLNFLVASLTPEETSRTIIVFDAGQSATGYVRSFEHDGLRVQFSAGKADADDLIEELIRANSAPRSLVVVSSDHRVQRAALRRRAQAIDSDKWIAALMRARSERREAGPAPTSKPNIGLSEVEVNYWLKRFGLEEDMALGETTQPAIDPPAEIAPKPPAPSEHSPEASSAPPTKELSPPKRRPSKSDKKPPNADSKGRSPQNPFPPGYGEDLLEDPDLD